MTITYTPTGVCSRKMTIEVEEGIIRSVEVLDGCNGNLQGISRLMEGMTVEEAIRRMDEIPLSINCWQLDDLTGFEDFDAQLTGGIQATGNAPGKPRSIEEYFTNLNKMLSLVPAQSTWPCIAFIP